MEANRKRCKVVMLPTNEHIFKGDIVLYKKLSPLHDDDIDKSVGSLLVAKRSVPNSEYWEKQNLYILSDDEIKEGDYYIAYGAEQMEVYQCVKSSMSTATVKSIGIEYKPMKIIATTDKSLKDCIVECTNDWATEKDNVYIPLDSPSEAFIKKYCEVGGIDEVDVEYVEYHPIQVYADKPNRKHYYPKVNSNNTIIIHPIKDSWSREEVMAILEKFNDQLPDCYSQMDDEELEDWANKNL